MAATTPHVGVRVFSDLSSTVASIDTRDSTVIGMVMPCPNIASGDASKFPLNEPVRLSTDDPEMVAALGAGLAQDAVAQIASEGVTTDLIFVRVGSDADDTAQHGLVVGSAALKTGIWALLDAKSQIGLEPGLIISPGFTDRRVGNAANPVVVAIDAVCERLIDCMGVVDASPASREAAVLHASDFATSLNIIDCYPAVRVMLNGSVVTRPMSPHVAAAIVRSDRANGTPFKAFWNKPLKGILGPARKVTYFDGRTDSDANFLNLAGVMTVIENKLLWGPFSTATDPTVRGYRSIKRIRTRRSIEKAIPRALRQYSGQDLGPHLVTLISTALAEAIEERKALGALIDGEIVWKRGLNQNTSLRDGVLKLTFRQEETPDLVDLQIFAEAMPEAYDTLWSSIEQAISSLGNPSIRVAA
ncbi:phage tail sheath family protein [Methylopila sp. 73B]|uniref:phage tail sheath family protein n=1 Tax=Methylopila sp. 73B TaxID=1120792 RepID=UPI00037C9C34|nr:phage tail sheath family protein [Methylopila sp. 73B]